LDAKVTTVIKSLEDHALATSEAHMQTAKQSVIIHDIKSGVCNALLAMGGHR